LARIVILGSAYPLRGGGMATFNERLARAFTQEGHDACIYTFSLQYPSFLFPGKTQYSDDAPPTDLKISVKVNSINPFNWLKVGLQLRKLKPDYLIIRYWIPFMAPCLGTIACITKTNKHTKVVAIADNIVPHEKRIGDKVLTKYFVNKIHRFVTMSDSVRLGLMKFGVSENKISVCPHPLYDNFGEPLALDAARNVLNLEANDKIVLFFGFIREYKGLDLLIKAFAHKKIRQLGIKLLVAGEFYKNAEIYHSLAAELGVLDSIIWQTEFIPNAKVREYFCAANLVAQPYRSATQSGVTQVAYHFEKPMLVTKVGGLPEMVPHLKAGYVVAPVVLEIVDAIVHFFEEEKGDEFKAFLQNEKKRFSWQVLVQALLNPTKN